MSFTKTTEQDSNHNHLEKKSVNELLVNINNEDKTIAHAVEKALSQIEKITEQIIQKLKSGGRLFYIGAGTSGRLGILDASECPPTFGVSHDIVIGLIAGGDTAIRKAVEFAEDSTTQGWKDLQHYNINKNDVVVGIAASGGVQAMGRNPDATPIIQTNMILGMAFAEAVAIYALAVALIIIFAA